MVIYSTFQSNIIAFATAMVARRLQRKINSKKKIKKRRERCGNEERNRQTAFEVMRKMTNREFKSMFRLSRESFSKLLKKVEGKLKKNAHFAKLSSKSPISPTTKLAATLRWLAGGSHHDISAFFGLSSINFFHPKYFLWETLDVLDAELELGFSLDENYLKETAEGFSEFSGGHLKHCVMAVDGWVCKTRQPTKKEVGQAVASYRNRKQCFGLVVLAGCDSKCKFTMLSVKSSGSTHDCTAWEATNMKTVLDLQLLPFKYYLIGDEAFVCTNQFLTPYSGSNLTMWQDSFNYHLSRMRQCIERAFGILTQRWGIFGEILDVTLTIGL
jgi:hypothetical protein